MSDLNATTILLDPNNPDKGTIADVITAIQGAIQTKADLTDIGGVIVEAQLPPLGETTTITRSNAAAMYGADLQGGDLCIRTDEGNSLYILLKRPAAVKRNWQRIWSPSGNGSGGDGSWRSLTDTPATIKPHQVVKGNSDGSGLTQSVLKSSDITNDSVNTGATVKEALDSLGILAGSVVTQTTLSGALAGKANIADLAAKADANHTHDASALNNDSLVTGAKISDALNNLQTGIDAVPDTSAVTSQINNAVAGKANQADLVSLQNDLANKADAGHHHDTRYYRQWQINNMLADKADAGALASKADANHSHDASELNNDSSVTGNNIRDALNNLQSAVTSGMTPLGGYNASTNLPALSNGSGSDGDLYWVTTAGTRSPAIDGITDLDIGDIIFAGNGSWHRVGRNDEVTSIFGRKGAIVAETGDYDASQVDNDSSVTGAKVSDALNTLKTGLDAVPDTADVTSQINTAIAGKADQTALNALQASVASKANTSDLAGKADANHTHDASDLNNDSNVTGSKISDALNTLKTDLDAVPDTADITSQINTAIVGKADTSALTAGLAAKVDQTELDSLKAQAATAQAAMQADIDSKASASDLAGKANANHTHDASELNNDSSVTGTTIRDALNNLQTAATSGMTPLGAFNANTNAPALSNGSGNDGDMYWVTTAGILSPAVDGMTDLEVGDIVFAAGGSWHRVGRTDEVTSVFGRKGAILPASGDYDASQIDNDSSVTGAKVSDALNTLKTDLDAVPDTADVTSQINTAIAGKADKSAVTTLYTVISNKADTNHTHKASDIPFIKPPEANFIGGNLQEAVGNYNTYGLRYYSRNYPTYSPKVMNEIRGVGLIRTREIEVSGRYASSVSGVHTPWTNEYIKITGDTVIDLRKLIIDTSYGFWHHMGTQGNYSGPIVIQKAIVLCIDNVAGHNIDYTPESGLKIFAKGGQKPTVTGIGRIMLHYTKAYNGSGTVISDKVFISKIDDDLQEVV